jgi:hypothetical protein
MISSPNQPTSTPDGRHSPRVGRDRSGSAAPDADRLVLTAERGQTEYGICSTAFLKNAFRTDSYRIEVVFNPDGRNFTS